MRCARARAETVAISPIVAGTALKGPADRLMRELGHESSVVGVARIYCDLAATLVVDEADESWAADVERTGMHCVVTSTVMSDHSRTVELARTALVEGADTCALIKNALHNLPKSAACSSCPYTG